MRRDLPPPGPHWLVYACIALAAVLVDLVAWGTFFRWLTWMGW
jgi:hypothetical protein